MSELWKTLETVVSNVSNFTNNNSKITKEKEMPHANLNDIVYLVGDETDKWPMLKDSSNFFMNKFNTMNYITVGLTNFPYSDFLINSKIVSNWHVVALDTSGALQDNSENIMKFQTIEKLNREYLEYEGEDTQIQFGTQQFIDYDTTKLHRFDEGNMRHQFADFLNTLESIEVARIDCPEQERWILSTIFDTGFLPSVMYIRFKENPGNCLLTRNTIGNLRMLGYALLYIHEDKYLFYYTNQSSYDLFNVSELGMQNPFVQKCIKSTLDALQTRDETKENGLSIKIKKFYTL